MRVMKCRQCGCIVARGERTLICGNFACCCRDIPIQDFVLPPPPEVLRPLPPRSWERNTDPGTIR